MRKAQATRRTKETEIAATLCLDGTGIAHIDTGIDFFDHMLTQLAVHGGFDISLICSGDLSVDGHHTVEDCGLVLGSLFLKALGDKRGITRFASVYVPMDEALARVCLDISGRSYLYCKIDFPNLSECFTKDYDPVLTEEFLRAFCTEARLTLHAEVLYGKNTHHITEAVFKALARALKAAVRIEGNTLPSSKGVI